MTFATIYRVSQYVMLFLATLSLNIDSTVEYPWVAIYPIAVAVAGVVAFLTVDRHRSMGLPRDLANVLAIVSIVPSFIEYSFDPYLLALAAGHWLVLLQLVKMFLPKTVEDDWFLFLLALTQVIVGAFLPGDWIGIVIILWAVSAVWTLTLFHLRRESDRSMRRMGEPVAAAMGASADPYPGLVVPSFVLSVLGFAFFTLALGALIFLLMPRWETSNRGRRSMAPAASLTGFSESVTLGGMGAILQSNEVVMTVELYDELDQRLAIDPDRPYYFRGVTLVRYENGTWHHGEPLGVEINGPEYRRTNPINQIRQRVKLEATTKEFLFSLRPVASAQGRDLNFNKLDGTIYRDDLRPRIRGLPRYNRSPGTFDYTVVSDAQESAVQPNELHPRRTPDLRSPIFEVPADLLAVLQPIVDAIVRDIPADDLVGRARAIESYLRDSGQFTYTLEQRVTDASLDPVADFLLNRRSGHCEYFASALALMLRTAGIPSRVVNGFKGGDWNELGQALLVRQKHAHSWVEAYLGQDDATGAHGLPVWLRLDGTPPWEQAEIVAQVSESGQRFSGFGDFVRYVWVFYVVGFDAERQQRVIYGPIAELFREIRRGAIILTQQIVQLARSLLRFQDVAALFSLRGFLVSFFGLLFVAGLVRLFRSVWRRLARRWAMNDTESSELSSAVASYRRLMLMLREVGLERPPMETPREFARRSGLVLAGKGPGQTDVDSVPSEVVDIYYRIRYGGQTPSADELESLDARLDALDVSLHPTKNEG